MPKAIDIANELHELADLLAGGGEIEIEAPNVYFPYRYSNKKDSFLALVKLLPRPLKKEYDEHDFKVSHDTANVHIWSAIERDKVCRVVKPAQPAEYECEPLLGEGEVAAIEEV